MSDQSLELGLQQLGIIEVNPFREGEIHDEALRAEVVAAQEPFLALEQIDRDWADMLLENPREELDRSSDDYKKYKEYLEEAKVKDDEVEGRDPEDMTLPEFELMRLRKFHRMLDRLYPVTKGFVAEFARAAARQHRYEAKHAGAMVYFKHFTKANIGILEGELSDDDRETFAPISEIPTFAIEAEALAEDPEAKALSDRYKVLKAMYAKRWAFNTLKGALGSEHGYEIDRGDVEFIARLIDHNGDAITK